MPEKIAPKYFVSAQDDFEKGSALRPADWFVLRTAALSSDRWLAWNEMVGSLGGKERELLNEPRGDDKSKLNGALRGLLSPWLLEGIYLASPALSASLAAWIKNAEATGAEAIEASLIAYFTRATGRPTPFGLFSCVSAGGIGQATHLVFSGESSYRRKTQISLPYLHRLYRAVMEDTTTRATMRYIPNPTLRPLDKNLHYLKRIEATDGKLFYSSATCSRTSTLTRVLAISDSGVSVQEIVDHLESTAAESKPSGGGTSSSEALRFVERLIEAQILLPTMGAVITGCDPAVHFMEQTKEVNELAPLRETTADALRNLEELDASGPGVSVARYRSIAERLLPVSESPDHPASHPFFADLSRTEPRLRLGKPVVDEILSGVQLLSRISAQNDPTWDRFTAKFLERFGPGREVPLLDLFDADFNFSFDDAPAAEKWNARDAHLLWKVLEALEERKIDIQLAKSDIDILRRSDPGKLPSCFAVLCSLLASSSEEISRGNYCVLIDGISRAGGLLGRFGGLDREWHERLQALVRKEQELSGDCIMADVVYDPPGNASTNVICRPALTEYVIPFFGVTSMPRAKQIRLSDLTVKISDDRVILWSRQLNKEVIPVHNTAYAFHHSNNPTVLRFLCKLAMGTSNVAWNWGKVLESFPFLPRLQYGRLIVARARWKIQRTELPPHRGSADSELLRRMQQVRQIHRLPPRVYILHEDKRLPVDLDNILSVRMLLRLTKQQEEITLTEFLPDTEHLCVQGPEGRFQHELILPAMLEQKTVAITPRRLAAPPIQERLVLPSAEWLYVKVYVRPSLLDAFLTGPFAELTTELTHEQIIGEWFFIRYADPYHHLRIRFRILQPEMAAIVFARLGEHLNPLLQKDLLWKWQVDSYEREIERYGRVAGMNAAEEIFCADSAMALKCLQWFPTVKEREDSRRSLCVMSVDELLNDFGVTLTARLKIVRELCDSFKGGIENLKEMKIQNGKEMRSYRYDILRRASRLNVHLSQYFRDRSTVLQRQAAVLGRLEMNKDLSRPVLQLVKDFIHLNVNRLMQAVTVKEEWKFYECLQKLYTSCQGQELSGLHEWYERQEGGLCLERRKVESAGAL